MSWRNAGRSCYCRLGAQPLRDVAEWAAGCRELREKTYRRLDQVLADLSTQDRRHRRSTR